MHQTDTKREHLFQYVCATIIQPMCLYSYTRHISIKPVTIVQAHVRTWSDLYRYFSTGGLVWSVNYYRRACMVWLVCSSFSTDGLLRSANYRRACMAWSVASYFSTGGLVWSVNHFTGARAWPGLVCKSLYRRACMAWSVASYSPSSYFSTGGLVWSVIYKLLQVHVHGLVWLVCILAQVVWSGLYGLVCKLGTTCFA